MTSLIASTLGSGALAQPPVASRPETIRLAPAQPESLGPGRIRFAPDQTAWRRLFHSGSARVADFPLPDGRRVDLEIAPVGLIDGRTRFFISDGIGLREVAGPPMRFFRGRVAGDPDSLVSLNLFGGRIAGFVRHDGREDTFGPRAFPAGSEGSDDIEMVDDSMEEGPRGTCDGHETPDDGAVPGLAESPAPGDPTTLAIDASTVLLGGIAIEGTVEWVARHGGAAAATTYTLNLMAQVSAIYENDIKVKLQIPYVLMNTVEPDGYSGASNNTSTVLYEMRARWNGTSSLRSVFRTAAHLFSTYPSGGAGRAYINVLCSNVPVNTSAYDYGVTLLEGRGGSWERRLVAHELGHNFSSPHSHCYVPEIDQCYNAETGCYAGPVVQTTGTIMSYCDVRVGTFHARERDEKIRPAAQAAYPRCLDIAGLPGDVGGLRVGPGAGGSVVLTWDPPCNDAAVPNQDYAVYRGTIGSWTGLTSVTCSTAGQRQWTIASTPPNSFWIVVPRTSTNEGSYGRSSTGQRPPALSACKPQAIGPCQ